LGTNEKKKKSASFGGRGEMSPGREGDSTTKGEREKKPIGERGEKRKLGEKTGEGVCYLGGGLTRTKKTCHVPTSGRKEGTLGVSHREDVEGCVS